MAGFVHRARSWRIAAALAGTVMVAAGCGGTAAVPGPAPATLTQTTYHAQKGTQGGKLVYSDWEQVTDLNVIGTSAATTQQATDALWAKLWTFGPDNKPVPDLVSEIPTQQNGDVKQVDGTHMDVTVKLKPGLKWSDGTALTTQDVKFTWQAVCDPATGAAANVGSSHIQSMEIKSPTVMVWHFGPNKAGFCGLTADQPNGVYAPYLLLATEVVPVPQHVLAGIPHSAWTTSSYFTKDPTATSGPYKVDSFVPGSSAQVVMSPNSHYVDGRHGASYFGHAPYMSQLIYKIYGDKSSQINALKTGDTDIGLDMIANDLSAARSITNDQTKIAYPIQDEMVFFNVANNTTGCAAQHFAPTCGTPTPWKDDPTVRQALALATDKQTMVKALVGGIGKVMNSPFPPDFSTYYDKSLPAFTFDLAKAKKLLAGDGWTMGSDGIMAKGGRKLEFTLSTTSGNPQRAAEEEQLVANWQKLGAKVSIQNHPAGEFFGGFQGNGTMATGQFDAGLFTEIWAPDPDSWSIFALPSQIPGPSNPAGQNWGRWTDSKLSGLFQKGANTIDPSQRRSIYNQAQQEWESYAGAIELYERPAVTVSAPFAGNFAPGAPAPGLDPWNIADWFHQGAS